MSDDETTRARASDDGPTPQLDPRLKTALSAVLVFGAICTLFAALGWGLHPALSTAMGAGLAASNLYALARIFSALLGPMEHAEPTEGAPTPAAHRASVAAWAFLAVAKMAVLFGGIWLLMVRGYVDALPLLVGYGSLPLGIAVGAVVSDRTAPGRS